MLHQIVRQPLLHARFINALARMEYTGVRKMLKARSSQSLDVDGLQHALEEASHAYRLKKFALQIAAEAASEVQTFAARHCLGGDAGESYLQTVDHACEAELADLTDDGRTDLNYLLSSALIEIRADAFYPLYESALREAESPISIRGILKDEERHLAEMDQRLHAHIANADQRIERVLALEEGAFSNWLAAFDADMHAWLASHRAEELASSN